VPLLDCSNEGVAHAFLHKIINKFGILVEILINQDTKLCGEFQSYVRRHYLIIVFLHNTFLKQMDGANESKFKEI
jgi:hypothetical protein